MNKGPGAEEKFKEISAAYEVTSTFLSLQNFPLVFFFVGEFYVELVTSWNFALHLASLVW